MACTSTSRCQSSGTGSRWSRGTLASPSAHLGVHSTPEAGLLQAGCRTLASAASRCPAPRASSLSICCLPQRWSLQAHRTSWQRVAAVQRSGLLHAPSVAAAAAAAAGASSEGEWAAEIEELMKLLDLLPPSVRGALEQHPEMVDLLVRCAAPAWQAQSKHRGLMANCTALFTNSPIL